MLKFKKLILASKSPRRQQLLKEAGFEFTIDTVDVEEHFSDQLKKQEVALYLSGIKADAYNKPLGDSVLLTADTIVCLGDRIINKPADEQEAFHMLKDLSGNMHEVFTGVTLKSASRSHSFFERTEVYFKPLTDAEISYYVEKCKPLDKAGAYGIQEWIGYIGVSRINGCFYNVMGLPLSRLYQELTDF